VSADGQTVSVTKLDLQTPGANYVWTAEVARGIFSRLNADRFSDGASAFSPDGRIAFTSLANGARGDIYSTLPNGTGTPALWVKSATLKMPNDFSPDGRFLVFEDQHATQKKDLWILSVDDRRLIPFVTTVADETTADFSPDGKWIAYSSDATGRREVYVQGFAPDQTPAAALRRWTISNAGGDRPRWSRDGKELYYLALDGRLMAVPTRSDPTFEPGLPVPLFQTRSTGFSSYDVGIDGRFLVNTVMDADPQSPSAITVVLNWQAGID
jgi:Tol biopolymer transport system component